MKNSKSQSLLGAILQLGIDEGRAQGKILNLYVLAQQGALDWDEATRYAGMGTDTDLFKRTALQYQMEEAQGANAQDM